MLQAMHTDLHGTEQVTLPGTAFLLAAQVPLAEQVPGMFKS